MVNMEITSGWNVGDSYNLLDEETLDEQIVIDFFKSKLRLVIFREIFSPKKSQFLDLWKLFYFQSEQLVTHLPGKDYLIDTLGRVRGRWFMERDNKTAVWIFSDWRQLSVTRYDFFKLVINYIYAYGFMLNICVCYPQSCYCFFNIIHVCHNLTFEIVQISYFWLLTHAEYRSVDPCYVVN